MNARPCMCLCIQRLFAQFVCSIHKKHEYRHFRSAGYWYTVQRTHWNKFKDFRINRNQRPAASVAYVLVDNSSYFDHSNCVQQIEANSPSHSLDNGVNCETLRLLMICMHVCAIYDPEPIYGTAYTRHSALHTCKAADFITHITSDSSDPTASVRQTCSLASAVTGPLLASPIRLYMGYILKSLSCDVTWMLCHGTEPKQRQRITIATTTTARPMINMFCNFSLCHVGMCVMPMSGIVERIRSFTR